MEHRGKFELKIASVATLEVGAKDCGECWHLCEA